MGELYRLSLILFMFMCSEAIYCQEENDDSFFLPDTVFFRINSSVIDSAERKKIELVANYLKEHPNVMLEIIAYDPPKPKEPMATSSIRFSRGRQGNVMKMLIHKYDADEDWIILPKPTRASDGDFIRCIIFRIRNKDSAG